MDEYEQPNKAAAVLGTTSSALVFTTAAAAAQNLTRVALLCVLSSLLSAAAPGSGAGTEGALGSLVPNVAMLPFLQTPLLCIGVGA